ncbi:MAG: hypothetical protein LC104_11500 [Bacteroidales bacterium]|nr:hypothetical protein [Bacteroidales bacterium]
MRPCVGGAWLPSHGGYAIPHGPPDATPTAHRFGGDYDSTLERLRTRCMIDRNAADSPWAVAAP